MQYNKKLSYWFHRSIEILVKTGPVRACLSLFNRPLHLKRGALMGIAALMFISAVLSSGIGAFLPSSPVNAQALTPCAADVDCSVTSESACILKVSRTWDKTTNTCKIIPATTSSLSLVQRTQSYAYLNALRRCMGPGQPLHDGQFNGISEANAKAGGWFRGTLSINAVVTTVTPIESLRAVSSYLGPKVDPVTGTIKCNELVTVASVLWGYTTPLNMLCDFVNTRSNGTPCLSGSGDFSRFGSGDDTQDANDFYSAIKRKAYGGNTPTLEETLSDGTKGYPGRYLLYKQAFLNGCEAKEGAGSSSAATYDNVKIVGDDGSISSVSFGGIAKDEKRNIYVNRDDLDSTGKLAIVTKSCEDITSEMRTYTIAYSSYRTSHPSEDANLPPAGTKTEQCTPTSAVDILNCVMTGDSQSCTIEGIIGWLLCPAFNWLSNISDAIFSLLADTLLKVDPKLLSQTNPSDPTKPGAVYATWSVMRNLANISFVIVFLIIIFSQMTSAGISNYGVKKMLPRLIIAALLVNLSFFVCQIGVDLSNVLGYSIKETLEGIGHGIKATAEAVNPDSSGIDFTSMLIAIFAINSLASGGSIMMMQAALILFLIIMIGALIAIIMTVLMLIGRLPLIIILTVLSPLAFVAFMLPNTKNVFTQWAKLYFALLMMFPLISLVFGLGSLTAAIITTSFAVTGVAAFDDVILQIIGMGVQLLPLFFVPFALKKLMGGMGALGGAMAALSNKASSAGKAVGGAAKAGGRALAKRGFNEGLGRMANSRFGNTKRGRFIGGVLSGRGSRGFSAMGAAHENETNKNIIDGWKRNNTYHNDSALEHIASSRPNTAEGRAAMAALAEKGSAEHLARVHKRIHASGDQHALTAYRRATDPHYSALKGKHPGAVQIMAEKDYAAMKSKETYDFKDDAIGEGIHTSSAFANMIRTAALDPLQQQNYSQATIAWAKGQGPAPGNPASLNPGPTTPPSGGNPIPGAGAPASAPAPAPTAGGGRRAQAPQGPPPTGGGAPAAAPTPAASTWTQVIQGATQPPTAPPTTTTTTNSAGGTRVTTSGPINTSAATPPAPEATDLSISHDNNSTPSAPRPSRRASQPGDLEARQATDAGNQTGFYLDSQGRQTPNSIAPGDADDYHSQFGG